MRHLTHLDHYEVLELPRGASPAEVERAYRMALETYADDSLAGYSVVSAAEVAALRQRMREAYQALTDLDSRQAYDTALAAGPEPEAPAEAAAEPAPVDEAFDDLEEGESEWGGSRLRRRRLRRGLELEEIAEITRIKPHYLECIETERFADLPTRVYLRGFVFAYARCLDLDAAAVAHSYVKRCEAAGGPARRRRRR